jgi:SAM-dependent methyltransferase
MGIDYAAAKKLIQLAPDLAGECPVLMLGRQRVRVKDRLKAALDRILAAAGFDLSFDDLTQSDGYGERFFEALGLGPVTSMDMTDFEGATVLHDLNEPVCAELLNRFGLIYDGGTTEHVFDVATCMSNIAQMLRSGGVFASCVPANGWFAHGFYQFGPELVYGYWKHGRGFDVRTCSMLPEMPRDKELPIPDPSPTGRRPRMRGKVPNQRVYLYYEVQKGAEAKLHGRGLQTDYVTRWKRHGSRVPGADTQGRSLTGHARSTTGLEIPA